MKGMVSLIMKYTTIAFATILFYVFVLSGCYPYYEYTDSYVPHPTPNERNHHLRDQIPDYTPAPPETYHPSIGYQPPDVGQNVPSYTPPPKPITQHEANPQSQNLRNNMGNRDTPPVRSPSPKPPPRKVPSTTR